MTLPEGWTSAPIDELLRQVEGQHLGVAVVVRGSYDFSSGGWKAVATLTGPNGRPRPLDVHVSQKNMDDVIDECIDHAKAYLDEASGRPVGWEKTFGATTSRGKN